MKSLLLLVVALLIQLTAGSASACTLAQPTGSVGNINTPPTGYITDIVANGTSDLTVTYDHTVSGTVSFGASSGITATGSWHGTKITSLVGAGTTASGTLSINGVVSLNTTGGFFSGSTSWAGGVTRIRGTGTGSNLVFFDGYETSTRRSYGYLVSGTCASTLSTATVDSRTQAFLLTVTAAEATSVNFYSDGVLQGTVAGPSPISIYARPYPGVHHITYDVSWTNGSVNGRDAANRNYFPIRVSSQGNSYTCAVQNGSAWCWGDNSSGDLGIGVTGGSYNTRQAVSGMSTGVSDISTSVGVTGGTTCAVKDGGVKCWGDNSNNVLQNGTGVASNVPVQVIAANSGIVQVGVGVHFACTLSNTGAVQCWGFGAWGQMGNGTWTTTSGKVTPTGLGSGVQSLSVGPDSVCVIQSFNVKCWGGNGYGQIGNNSTTMVNVPTSTGYSFGTSLLNVSVGQYLVCVTGANQSVWCWGRNDQDGTGTPGQPTYKTPMLVPLTGAVGTIVGAQVACAGIAPPVSSDYTPECWGANDLGQLGNGFISDHEDPPEPPISVPWTFAGSASNTVCMVTDGHLKCWGQNGYGQVGAGPGLPNAVVTPTLVTGF